jgi:hypothetical protein
MDRRAFLVLGSLLIAPLTKLNPGRRFAFLSAQTFRTSLSMV